MITKESFVKQFDQLSASFNRAMSAKHLDARYEEVENRDPSLFLKACQKLKYGDKFPNFASFRAAFIEAQTARDHGQPARPSGCEWCHEKLVIWESGDYTCSGKCRYCHPDDADNVVDPKKIDTNPKLNLIKPLQEADEPIPREALQELMSFISGDGMMSSGQLKTGDEVFRANNLSRDHARDNRPTAERSH
jgi:hypothetical protein